MHWLENGREIQCRPDEKYCITYPSFLNDLPSPPPMGVRKSPSKTVNSTNRQETIMDAGTDWIADIDEGIRDTFINVHYDSMDEHLGLMLAGTVTFSSITEKNINSDKFALTFDMPILLESIAGLWGLDYLQNLEDDNNLHAVLMEWD